MSSIVFAGTPLFAANHLKGLIDAGYQPDLVLTQPDRIAGRGKKVTASPVKQLATQHDIDVLQPALIDASFQETLVTLPKPDLMIVVAYGLLLPEWLLDWPKYGAVNVHASLLPRWRGAAPIQRAIEAGDNETGVGIMQMAKGLDTGPIWAQSTVPITKETTAIDLHDRLQQAGTDLLIEMMPTLLRVSNTNDGSTQPLPCPVPQSLEGVTYAHKLSKQEAAIDWHQDAETICRKIRAFNLAPVAFSHAKAIDSDAVSQFRFFNAKVRPCHLDVAPGTVVDEDSEGILIRCQTDAVLITELQEVGKKRLPAKVFLNGKSLANFVFYG